MISYFPNPMHKNIRTTGAWSIRHQCALYEVKRTKVLTYLPMPVRVRNLINSKQRSSYA